MSKPAWSPSSAGISGSEYLTAAPGTFMTHLAVQEAVDGVTAEWGEHAIDEYPA